MLRVATTALVLGILLAPATLADHAYSHRYIVFGRVVDAAGSPVQGLDVAVEMPRAVWIEGPCDPDPRTWTEAFGTLTTRPVTNDQGEFVFCSHVHEIPTDAGAGVVTLEGGGSRAFEIDPARRLSFVLMQLPDVDPRARIDGYDHEYTVWGRFWRPSQGEDFIEGVRVAGETLDLATVRVLIDAEGVRYENATRTNGYGDFSVRVPVDHRLRGGTIQVSVGPVDATRPVDPTYGGTGFLVDLPSDQDRFVGGVLGAVAIALVGGAAVLPVVRRLRPPDDGT